MFRFAIAPLLSLLYSMPLVASPETFEIETASGQQLDITAYNGGGQTLLLWLPSERGLGEHYQPLANALAELGIEVWSLDLHRSYMVPEGRESIAEFDAADLQPLLAAATARGFRQIGLFSSGRGAVLALQLARHWQAVDSGSDASAKVSGLIFSEPHLLQEQQQEGSAVDYVPAALASNLPVALLQPQYSTKFARLEEISTILSSGGSEVYVQALQGVNGGFYARPPQDLTDVDRLARQQMPQHIQRLLRLMAQREAAPLASVPEAATGDTAAAEGFREPGLYAVEGRPAAPALVLSTLDGQVLDLMQLRGSSVLLNFWATWCGPCIEEIPSLNRLQQRLKAYNVRIISVNIGETPERIRDFAARVPIEFPVLLDGDGDAVRDWHVYAYPSNYLLDARGRISHAYRGALEWDEQSIVETILSVAQSP